MHLFLANPVNYKMRYPDKRVFLHWICFVFRFLLHFFYHYQFCVLWVLYLICFVVWYVLFWYVSLRYVWFDIFCIDMFDLICFVLICFLEICLIWYVLYWYVSLRYVWFDRLCIVMSCLDIFCDDMYAHSFISERF